MDKLIRLQKYFTDCGIMSRRAAETEIAAGHVTVNGTVAEIGQKIDPERDTVMFGGNEIKAAHSRFTYIMLNKPLGYVTTMSDEQSRHTVSELIADAGVRVYPVGRLDMYSEGLLLMTDDGALANALMHPSRSVPKLYRIKLKGALSANDVNALLAPMEFDGYRLRPVEVRLVTSGRTDSDGSIYSTVEITLHEGRNRQIRRMCEKCGLCVMRLARIALGDLTLGTLPAGKWRHLTDAEVHYIKDAVSLNEAE